METHSNAGNLCVDGEATVYIPQQNKNKEKSGSGTSHHGRKEGGSQAC